MIELHKLDFDWLCQHEPERMDVSCDPPKFDCKPVVIKDDAPIRLHMAYTKHHPSKEDREAFKEELSIG